MKTILKKLLPYKSKIILSLLLLTAATACDLLLPTLMSNIVDYGIYRSDMDYIIKNCIYMLVISLTGFGTVILGRKLSADVVAGFCCDLRRMVFAKVNTMTFGEMSEIGTAALVTRSTHDTDTLGWVASMLCSGVITIPALFIGGVLLSLSKDVLLSMIFLCFVPVVFAVVCLIGKRIEPLWREADIYIDRQNDIMRERLHGIRVIRAFGKEDKEHSRIVSAIKAMTENIIRSNVSIGIISPLSLLLFNLSVVIIVYFGAVRMQSGANAVSAGDIFAIIQYVTLAMNSVVSAGFVFVAAPQAKVAGDRIGEVLRVNGDDDKIPAEDIKFSGDVVFDHVTFKYEGAAEPAISDISFHIRPGQKVSIIGGTGSGKSTLVSLMLCFRMPTEGAVKYDGRATETLSHQTVRDNLSCVLQHSSIYSGTIRENILMGKPDATEAEICEAAQVAQLSSFVDTLNGGYDYVLNQAGKNISGGQKQRISIARAVVKNAPIYIFDDSFSALDFLTEKNLRAKLAEKAAGHTQIVITQRVTSAMSSDVIFVMDGGKIVDSGTHSELLERCQIYKEIYASQTGGAHE
ncbi:MAG: ABC transporter ATP-binding protein [Oscillospiraceae bacterium]